MKNEPLTTEHTTIDIDDMREAHETIAETNDVIVFADHGGHELNSWAEQDGLDRDELSRRMHKLARDITDYDWGASDPVVVSK